MKRIVSVMLVLVLVLIFVYSPGMAARKKVVLSVTHNWYGADAHAPWTKWALGEFQKRNPNITLDINEVPSANYRAKIRADLMGNVATDIILWYGGAEAYDYVKPGLLMNLTSVLAPLKGNFISGSLGDLSFNGKIYGVPACENFFAFYLNMDIYKKFGFAIPKSYKELLTQVTKFKEAGLIPIMLPGQNHPGIAQHFFSFIANATTKKDDFEKASYGEGKSYKDPGFVKAAKIIAELQKKGAFDPNVDGISMASVEDMFDLDKGAMYFTGIWRVGSIKQSLRNKMKPILFPPVKGFTQNPNIATSQMEMGWIANAASAKNTAKKNAIIKFMKFFASKVVNQKFVDLTDTVVPVHKDVNLSKASLAVRESARIVEKAELRPFLRYFQSPAQGVTTNEIAWNLINGRGTVTSNLNSLMKVPLNKR
jgi:raffinose/stachyose/melibiose transport system substrate-binding protein